jgi:hypothetical protein
VLPRLLSGYDYVVARHDGAAEIVVIGASRNTAVATAPTLAAHRPNRR